MRRRGSGDEVLGVDADVADTEQHDLGQPGVDT